MNFSAFMNTYLSSRALENRKTQDFSEYLLRYGNDPRPAYEKTLAGAREAYLRARPSYGTVGDSLARSGLSSSGYAGFLAEEARDTLKKGTRAATAAYTDALKEEERSYRDFLDKEQKESETLRSTLERRLISMNMTDRDTAYAYLVSGGLSDTDARATAENVLRIVSEKKRDEVIERSLHYGYDGKLAYQFAITEGLTPEDAAEIAAFAEEAFQHGGSMYVYFKEHFSPTPLK